MYYKRSGMVLATILAVSLAAAAVLGLLALASPVYAVVYSWDIDTGTAGAQDGGGTWNNSATFWDGVSQDFPFGSLTPPIDVNFGSGGSGGSISFGGNNVSVNSLTLGPVTTSYNFSNNGVGTFTIGAGGITMNSGVLATTISKALIVGAGQTWADNSSNDLTFDTGGITFNALVTVNSFGTGKIILNETASGTGGLKLQAGTVQINTAGAIGGQIELAGGTLDQNIANSVQIISNNLLISGPTTLAGSAGGSAGLSFQGPAMSVSGGTLTNNLGGGVFFATNPLFLSSDFGVSSGTSGPLAVSGGLTIAGTRTLTITRANTTTDSIGGPLSGTVPGQWLLIRNSGTGRVSVGGSLPLFDGPTVAGLVLDGNGAGGYFYGGSGNTYSGGTTIQNGAGFYLTPNQSSTPTSGIPGVVTSGPWGRGPVTLSGATIYSAGTGLHSFLNNFLFDNSGIDYWGKGNAGNNGGVTINGNVTFNGSTPGIPTTFLVVNSTGVTYGPNYVGVNWTVNNNAGPPGNSIGLNNNVQIGSLDPIGSVTLNAGIFGGTNNLTVLGMGSTSITGVGVVNPNIFGGLYAGENVASGARGGIASINDASAIGSNNATNISTLSGARPITINYGGAVTLNPQTSSTVWSAPVTVNAFGKLFLRSSSDTYANITVNSFGSLGTGVNQGGPIVPGVLVPATGALLFESAINETLTISGAQPPLTGTMMFGDMGGYPGRGPAGFTAPMIALSSDGTARTMALNIAGGDGFNLGGITNLNAPLTIAGVGTNLIANTALPANGGATAAYQNIGTISVSSINPITVAMSPIGSVWLNPSSTAWGSLNVNGGMLDIYFDNLTSTKLGSGPVTLNGGWIRSSGRGGDSVNFQAGFTDNITVAPGGGGLDLFSDAQGSTATFLGNISSSGPLGLRYGCYQGAGSSNGANVLTLSGINTGSGAMRVQTTNGSGRVQFTGVASMGSGTISVDPGAMFSFDSPATYSAVTTWPNIVTQSNSVLALNNLLYTNIDLSPTTGINKDIRLGTNSTISYYGQITPYANTYNFTVGGGNTSEPGDPTQSVLYLFKPYQLTDLVPGVKYNVDVAAGAMTNSNGTPTGAYDAAFGELALDPGEGADDYSGTTAVTGTIRNAYRPGIRGTMLVVCGAVVPNTTGATVNRGALFNIFGVGINPNFGSNSCPINVRGGGVLLLGEAGGADFYSNGNMKISNGDFYPASNDGRIDYINPVNSLTLGGNEGGGQLTMAFGTSGTTSQTFANLFIGDGLNTIISTNPALNTLNLTFTGAYIRSPGGLLNYVPATGFNVFGPSPTGSSISGVVGTTAIFVGALINGWADQATGDFIPVASFLAAPVYSTTPGSPFVIAPDLSTWSGVNLSQNILVSSTTFNSVANGATINSLKLTSGQTIGFGASSNLLTVSSGMILATTGNCTFGSSATPGRLTSGQPDLIFLLNMANNSAYITVYSQISASALTVEGYGNLELKNTTNVIGDVYINGGTVVVDADGALGTISASRTIYLNNTPYGLSSLYTKTALALNQVAASGPSYSNTNLYVGTDRNTNPDGNSVWTASYLYANSGAGNTTTIGTIGSTTITLNGNLAFGQGDNTTYNRTTGGLTLAGDISGPGVIGASNGAGRAGNKVIYTLSGNNQNWSGGINTGIANGTNNAANLSTSHLRIDHGGTNSSLGTGPVVVAAGADLQMYLDSNAVGGSGTAYSYANPFVVNGNLVLCTMAINSGLTSSSGVTTLTGDILGQGNLFVQGYATGDTAISELVLNGNVGLSGWAPVNAIGNGIVKQKAFGYASPSFFTTNGATPQAFVNGPGGITLGTTDIGMVRTSATAAQYLPLSSGYQTQWLIDAPAGVSEGTVSGTVANGALGFLRFAGAQSFIPGAVGNGYLAALRRQGVSGDTNAGRFGFLLTAGANYTYTLPEGKSFVIGSLGAGGTGTPIGGTLGAAGGGTAILVGSPKLAGAPAGDVNIHANGQTDNQQLDLLARDSSTLFQIGTAIPVVFTPTYGDSGYTSSYTVMADRTGNTTLNKIGIGILTINNASYQNLARNADLRNTFTWNVNTGTLNYNQNDGAAPNFAGFNVAAGAFLSVGSLAQLNVSTLALNGPLATLAGSGTVNGNTTLTGNGVISFANLASTGQIVGTLGVTGGNWNGGGSVTGLATSASGTFTIGSGANLTAIGGLNVAGGTFAAADTTSTITGSVSYASPSTSTFAGVIAGAGNTLSLVSGGSTLILTGANTYTGLTTVKAGTLQLVGTTAVASAWDPVFYGGGADIQGGKMVFDYTTDGITPATTIQGLLAASYNPAGPWIGSQFQSTTADASHGLGWADNGAGQVKVAYTFYGDATLDGSVDATDLAKVLANYNQLSGMVWSQGDFDYNATVDASDLAKVLANYNQGPIFPGITTTGLDAQAIQMLTAAGFTVVPEPSPLVLLGIGAIGLLAWAWRRRRS